MGIRSILRVACTRMRVRLMPRSCDLMTRVERFGGQICHSRWEETRMAAEMVNASRSTQTTEKSSISARDMTAYGEVATGQSVGGKWSHSRLDRIPAVGPALSP